MLIALLYSFFLKDYAPWFVPFTWCLMMLVMASYRLLLWQRRKKHPLQYTYEQWIIKYVIATGLTGVVWGSSFLLPYTHYDVVLYAAVSMVFFGVTASAVSILTVSLTAFFCYTLPLITSLIVTINQLSEFDSMFFTIGLVVYYLMLSLFARNSNKQIISSIVLTLHNQILISQLRNKADEREQLVQDRTRQLLQSDKTMVETQQRLQNVITAAELGSWDWNYQTGAVNFYD